MDNFNSGKIKEMVYDVLQNPTRENFIDILDNGLGEQDNLDFKVQWIEAQKLAEIKGITAEEVKQVTTENAHRLYRLTQNK